MSLKIVFTHFSDMKAGSRIFESVDSSEFNASNDDTEDEISDNVDQPFISLSTFISQQYTKALKGGAQCPLPLPIIFSLFP